MFFKSNKEEKETFHVPTLKEIGDKVYKEMYPHAATEEDFDKDLKEISEHKDDFNDTYFHTMPQALFNMQVKEATIKDIDSLIETIKVNPMVVFDRDDEGNTPLHNAVAKQGFEKLIVEIVNAGAEIEARNNKNQTPADIAVSPAVSTGLTRHALKQKAFMHNEATHCKRNGITPSLNQNVTGDTPRINKAEIMHKIMDNKMMER